MKNCTRLFLLLIGSWIGAQVGFAQPLSGTSDSKGAIFYEISGNGLKESSYLFGTFHLLTSSYVDTLPGVMQAFNACKTFAGEMIIDSTLVPKMREAAFLKGTTLDKILTEEEYAATATWLKELTGYDLAMFNTASPMTVSTVLAAYVQQQIFPQLLSRGEPGMDEYFQQLSLQNQKQLIGLELVEDQINALYTQYTNERQAELLMAMVRQKHTVTEGMLQMLNSYRKMDLSNLMSLMYDATFTKAEVEVLLDNRNKKWMNQLPDLMHQSGVFIAVGALHLGGEHGLVQLLQNAGYTVKSIKT